MSALSELNKKKMLDKIVHFLSNQLSIENIKKAYYLKTINETGNVIFDLKRLINSGNYFKLALLKNENPYNFDRLDDEGVVEVIENFYEIYLIIDTDNNYYFVILNENNFFNGKPINELEFMKKVRPFLYKIYFFNRKLLA